MDRHFVTYHHLEPIAPLWAIVVALLFVVAAIVLWRFRRLPSPAPRRRWFRFSLRTLFVLVTALACWLGWELNIVRQRQQLWRSINESRGYTLSGGVAEISMIRSLLSDRPREVIAVPSERFSQSEIATIVETFPEAIVLRDSQEAIRRQGDEDTE